MLRKESCVNLDIKLLILGQLFWREYVSSFGFSRPFLSNWPRKRTSDQQSNSQKINSLMSKFTSADSNISLRPDEKNSSSFSDDDEKNDIEGGSEYYPHYPQADKATIVSDGLRGGTNGHSPGTIGVKPLSATGYDEVTL